jgi:hypothetical protein
VQQALDRLGPNVIWLADEPGPEAYGDDET